ncbi:hypothetical protein WKK_01320 [Weissella koreensis KACC 15510]|uniref:hypothetical protein n=1 Tax=Weissella koreensis TaxID=165096 RepID=UPI000217459B|nr:hypothetical protein [Weissella koreensis]AEJ23140.1 hypothetical protein WKK_01320 [Weissella koreensis KACC 15510]
MVKEYIYTTFGTKDVLQTVQQRYSNRPIYLTFDLDDHEHFQLIEYSINEKSPFSSGVQYDVLFKQNQSLDLRGLMDWNYLTLNDDEREHFIMRAKAWITDHQDETGLINIFLLQVNEGFDYAILTTWKTEKQLQEFKPIIDDFFKSFQYASNVHYREKKFQFAKF